MATYIPIKKLTDTSGEYYPLSVTKSVYTPVQLVVANNIGGYKVGDVIPTETCFHDILYKLLCIAGKNYVVHDEIDNDFLDPQDDRIPSTLLVYQHLQQISSDMSEKQDADTAVTRVALSSCGSVTLPVFVNTAGRVQTITSYEGNSATATKANAADKLTVATTGSATKPVYFSGGIPVAITSYEGKAATAGTADEAERLVYHSEDTTKVGISCGSETNPVYFNNGIPVAISGNIGDNVTPVFISNGEITEMYGNIGSNTGFVYVGDGSIKKSNANVGNGARPIYLEDGEFKPMNVGIGSNRMPVYVNDDGNFTAISGNLGSEVVPVYISNGEFVQCQGTLGGAANKLVNINTAEDYEVGSDRKTIVYFKNGVPTPSDWSSGTPRQPVYINNGKFTKLSGDMGEEGNPIYIDDDGSVTPMSSTIGSSTRPVFLSSGFLTQIADDAVVYAGNGLERDSVINSKLNVIPATTSEIGGVVLGDVVLDSVSGGMHEVLNYPKLVVNEDDHGRENGLCNSNPYLNLVDHSGTKVIDSHRLFSTDALSIKSDINGRIIFDIGTGLRYVKEAYSVNFGTYTEVDEFPTDTSEISKGAVYKKRSSGVKKYFTGKTGSSAWKEQNNSSDFKWFRIWSDGWIEQGGVFNVTATSAGKTIIKPGDPLYFDINFAGSNYNIYYSQLLDISGTEIADTEIADITFSSVRSQESIAYILRNPLQLQNTTPYKFVWKAEGYANVQ